MLYLDVDFRNGQQYGFIHSAALHHFFIAVAALLIFAGIRVEQWDGLRYAASRCIFLSPRFGAVMRVAIGTSQWVSIAFAMFVISFSFAMHFVTAGGCTQGRGRRHGCRCSSLHLLFITARFHRDAPVHAGQVRPRRARRRDCFRFGFLFAAHLNLRVAIRVNFWVAIRVNFWVAMCLNVWVAMCFNF